MTDQPTYTPPPGDQAQLDALGGYLPLLNNLMEATEAHYEAASFLHHILATGKFDAASRAEAYKAQGATARAMLQAFAAMQQAAPRPPLPSNLPTRPDALLTSVNGRVEVPYDNIPHLWQALRNEYGDPRWQWPQPRDLDGWRDAYARAFAHAQRKVTPASPVALSEGDAEPEQSF